MEIEKFDAVVIGSGFGGSVMSERLSAAGMSVCLLERGRAYPPGSFARTPNELKKAFWDPSKQLYGLFNIWSFKKTDIVVASGLGGGSLIYANVLIEKPKEWFDEWPISYDCISENYRRVKAELAPVPYPYEKKTLKTQAMKEASEATGLELLTLDLAITFGNDPALPTEGEQLVYKQNLHGKPRFACRLCGECYLGCNYGSKNTLDFNYLSKAKRNGTQIRELCEVTKISPASDGTYDVWYKKHDPSNPKGIRQPFQLNCRYLILAAGSLGSTYLLLKNQDSFKKLSPRLGHNYSGNGDLKAIVTGCKENASDKKRVMTPEFGPVITLALKSDKKDDKNSRFLIEDWSFPSSLLWMVEAFYSPSVFRNWSNFLYDYLKGQVIPGTNPEIGNTVSKLIEEADRLSNSLPLVGMGIDASNGIMKLDGREKYLKIELNNNDSSVYFKNVFAAMETIKRKFRATSLKKLLSWRAVEKSISVHPLGGCPMATSIEHGVVNEFGEVFNYPGFFIADGSVIPSAIGVNPALTIAALADRFSLKVISSWRGE